MECEHICDTYVYQCISTCKHDTQCMRQCWITHDKCAINCPCNAECPDGCPEPYAGHPCETWFCQGEVEGTCAAEDDPVREGCPYLYEDDCKADTRCCFVKYTGDHPDVPWCFFKKLPDLNPLF